MSKLFHLNLEVEMPLFANEYFYVFGKKLVIDKTMKIKCYLSPIVIMLTNFDYNLIMKILFHNITFDDGCDRFYIHNFEINQ